MFRRLPATPRDKLLSQFMPQDSAGSALTASWLPRLQNLPCAIEIGLRIHTERYGVDNRRIDPHACFQRTKLFQPFPSLQHSTVQCDEFG